MAKGKWVTINGAHIFLEEGQSVDDAFDESVKNSPKQAYKSSTIPGEGERAPWAEEKGRQAELKSAKTLGEKAKKTVKSIESDIRYLDYEKGIIVSKDGDILFEKDGAASEVVVPSELLMDAIFTHNHPHSLVFSGDDIKGFLEGRLYQLRATTPDDKTYILTRTKDFVKPSFYFDYKNVGKRSSLQEYEVQRKFEEYIGLYDDFTAINLALSDVRESWLKENAEKYNVKFEVEYG